MRRAPAVLIYGSLLLAALLQSAIGARAQEDASTDVRRAVGRGDAGYDDGLWIRRGAFSLKVNATLQARFEAWAWDADEEPLDPALSGGDLSGFALPRATLKLSGGVPCSVTWFAALEFGHAGEDEIERRLGAATTPLGPLAQSHAYDILREAWIQWSPSDLLQIRAGRIPTAAPRQLMTPPEMQQFVDVSLASAFVGSLMPGYTDRNRDHGLAVHGRIGARNAWSYLVTLTNAEGGDGVRNVLDGRTSGDLALSARINHAFRDPIGYEEGALRQSTCDTYGEVGIWAWCGSADALRFGIDLALGYRGFAFTGAAVWGHDENAAGADAAYAAYLAQLGYHPPGGAWSVALRWSLYDVDNPAPALTPLAGQQHPLGHGAASELALAVHYYLNGHGNKIGVDVALVSGHDPGSTLLLDPYAGYPGRAGATGAGGERYGVLLRLQWQLAL